MPGVTASDLIGDEFTAELKGQNAGTLTWRVKTDGLLRAPEVIFDAYTASPDPVLSIGTYVSNGIYVLRNNARLEVQNNAKQWIVTAECGPWPADSGGTPGGTTTIDGIVNHPWNRKVIWSAERIAEQEAVYRDYLGAAIVNSANDPYDEAITKDRYITVYVGTKNFRTLNDAVAANETFDDSISNDVVLGRAAETMRFIGMEISQPQYENGVEFYTGTIRIAYKKAGWRTALANTGWRYFDRPKTDPAAKKLDTDPRSRQPLSEPVKLKADGTILGEAEPITYTTVLLYTPKAYAPLVADPVYTGAGP